MPTRYRKTKNSNRKYGRHHRNARKQWAALLPLPCTVCRRTVHPGTNWHLDHTDDGTAYLGPAHAYCNLAKAARKRNSKHTHNNTRRLTVERAKPHRSLTL